MQDSHSSLYSTKTLYHLHISDPFRSFTENVDCFIKVVWNTQKNTSTNFFEYQVKMFLNIEKVLVKISEERSYMRCLIVFFTFLRQRCQILIHL